MNSQNKKINVYDFNFKIDDDFYFVNGVSYKRIDICIPESENFTNSDDLINYINNIETNIGKLDTNVIELNLKSPDIDNLYLSTSINCYNKLQQVPESIRCNIQASCMNKTNYQTAQSIMPILILRINTLINNITIIQTDINNIIKTMTINVDINSNKNIINDNIDKIKNSNINITRYNNILTDPNTNQPSKNIARTNMYAEYVNYYKYNMNVINAQQAINKLYI